MSEHLARREADRLRRAESRWLEQARERLRRTPASGTRMSSRPQATPQATPAATPQPDRSEETDR